MGKITEKKAMKLLEEGKIVRCKISPRDEVPVRTKTELQNLLRLKAENVQMCDIFFDEGEVEIPENAMEISLDDAIKLIAEGEIVYGKRKEENGEDEEITTQNVLMQYYRSALLVGEPVLYYYIS